MNALIRLIVLFVICTILFPAGICSSQENATEYSFGEVVSVDAISGCIILREFGWGENDEEDEIEVTYSVAPDTEVENVSSWKTIAKGSDVDIEYIASEGGKLIAKRIIVYEETPSE